MQIRWIQWVLVCLFVELDSKPILLDAHFLPYSRSSSGIAPGSWPRMSSGITSEYDLGTSWEEEAAIVELVSLDDKPPAALLSIILHIQKTVKIPLNINVCIWVFKFHSCYKVAGFLFFIKSVQLTFFLLSAYQILKVKAF